MEKIILVGGGGGEITSLRVVDYQQKRGESNTVSTDLSNKPASKNPRYKGILEPVE